MASRNVNKGIRKADFKSEKEYSFTEAQEILGPCKRKKITFKKHKQYCVYPSGWEDLEKPTIIEEYDVWVNKRGDMLLAIPLPENTLNIKDFEF